MTVTAAPVSVLETRPSRARAVAALALTEARELLRHPLFLLFVALSAALFALAVTGFGDSNAGDDESFLLASLGGLVCLPIGLGTLVATNLAVLRARRDRVEQFDAVPLPPAARTAAHLWAVMGAVAVAVAATAGSYLISGAGDGLSVAFQDGRRQVGPALSELIQGPMFVLAMGFAGVAFARILPWATTGVAVGVLAFPQIIVVSWMSQGTLRWFSPITHDLDVARWVDASPAYSYPVFEGIETGAMAWHDLYLAGLAVVFAGLALARSSRARGTVAVVAAGAAATLAGGVMQVAAS